jgi:hypothetical protein
MDIEKAAHLPKLTALSHPKKSTPIMSHSEILAKLDELLALSGAIDPFGTLDLALVNLRYEIGAATLAEESAQEEGYRNREDYHHACTYAAY